MNSEFGNFVQVAEGFDVTGLLKSLNDQEFLWNKNPARLSKRGPHKDSDDIFIRGEDETEFLNGTKLWKDHGRLHAPVWYKSVDYLPEVRPLINALISRFCPDMLGGCYIYRVKPGNQVYPHIDRGWHPEYFEKLNICIQSNDRAAFVYDNDKLVQKAGDVHFFKNDRNHSVVNEGDCDHIILIVCLRLDRGYRCPWSPDGWTLDKQLGV